MTDKNLTQNEIEMIKEYQLNKSEDVALYFYKKFSNDLANIIYSRINSKFSSIPLERNDLLHLIWKGIKEELEEFDENKNYSLFNGFVQKGYQKSLREAIGFLNNGHILLNVASSIEEMNDLEIKHRTRDGVVYQQLKYDDAIKDVVEKITPYFAKNTHRKIQKIIYLKSCGFSLDDIHKKIRVPIREVRSLIDGIKIIGEILYKSK